MFWNLALYCGFSVNILFSDSCLFVGLLKKIIPKMNAQAVVNAVCLYKMFVDNYK